MLKVPFFVRRIQRWLRHRYNQRYAILKALQSWGPSFARDRASDYLKARPMKKPSLGSRLLAMHAIDLFPEDTALSEAIAFQLSGLKRRYFLYRAGDRMLRGRIYGSETESLLKRAATNTHEINATFRYLDYLTQAHGYDHPDVVAVSRRFESKGFRRSMTRGQKVKACVMLLLSDRQDLAEEIYLQLPRLMIVSGRLPIFLQHAAFERQWRNYEFLRRGWKQYRTIVDSRAAFEQLIRNEPGAFCVVGNGPSELGRGRGGTIDLHKVVIRINAYDLSHPEDYGSKQSVWVRVPNEEASADHARNNSYFIIASNQFEYKRSETDKYCLHPYLLEMKITTIPPAVFQELIARLNCLPSTGLALLYWIYTLTGPIPREQIYGFSHVEQLDDFRTHYYKDAEERTIHQHAWDKEIVVMESILQ